MEDNDGSTKKIRAVPAIVRSVMEGGNPLDDVDGLETEVELSTIIITIDDGHNDAYVPDS